MLELTLPLKIYLGLFAALLGLVMGSFLNCAAIRIVKGEGIARGRSHCVFCGHVLSPLELIPLLSFVFQRGRCRSCGEKLSLRYPISELISAVVFVSVTVKYGLSLKTLEFLILSSLLLLASFADLEDYLIPDRCIVLGIICRAVFVLLSPDIGRTALSSLIGGLCVSLPVLLIVIIMEKLLKKEAMGGGDIKLLFMGGLYFNWKVGILTIFAACVIGIIFGLISTRRSAQKLIPFGPAISCAFWISMLCGKEVISFYTSLF